jgi:glycine/D-amino acid oxidase-like deaminating enzyme
MYNTKNQSYWHASYYYPQYDVIVVGGGFTGLTAGIEMLKARPLLKVGIIESQIHGTLASSRNAGFMCFGSPTELVADLSKATESEISKLLTLKQLGYHTLLNNLKGKKGIYKKTKAFELFEYTDLQKFEEVKERLPQLNSLMQQATGIADYYIAKKSPYNNPSFHWIHFAHEGQIHPAAALETLKARFLALGGRFHAGIKANQIERTAQGFCIQTNVSLDFNSHELIVANNAFVSQLFPEIKVQPKRAQVLVTESIKNLPYIGNFHMNCGYVYFRNIGNMLLLGGLRNTDFDTEETDELGLNESIQSKLADLAARLIPHQAITIKHRWSGIMGFHEEGVPRMLRHANGAMVVAGMNGMGTLLGPALGKLAAAELVKVLKR